jgi:hypothetical protein
VLRPVFNYSLVLHRNLAAIGCRSLRFRFHHDKEKEWLEKRKEAFDEIGSKLIAFADTNSLITHALTKSRYFALRAGNDLRLLGAVYPGTQSWADVRKRVRSALRLGG